MNIKNIIFDFDGVILDSVPVKTEAFKKLFEGYDDEAVEKLIRYHIANGGVSRYAKIRYFFEEILKTEVSEENIQKLAQKYSELTKEELTNPKYLISETIEFINNNYQKYNMHIASGADENDLLYIAKRHNLTDYFVSIHGSPTPKHKIVSKILHTNAYDLSQTILIGDSKNDYDAAVSNGIKFYGFNNEKLKNNHPYISSFTKDFIENK